MIEHPDHTGASANPLAPWNQENPYPTECDECGAKSESLEDGDRCDAGDTFCDGIMRDPELCDRHGYAPQGCPCDDY